MKTFIPALVLYLFFFSAILNGQVSVYPEESWNYSTPAAEGMSESNLDSLVVFLDDYYSDALLIIRNGFIVKEKYWGDYTCQSYHDIASIIKSFTSAAIGHAIASGKISGVEQSVSDFLPQVQDSDIKLRHALTMTLRNGCRTSIKTSENWLQAALECPLVGKPGEVFHYNDISPMMAGGTLQEATGCTVEQFFTENIADVIGMRKVYWWSDPAGNIATMGHAKATIYDCARFGYLYLNMGRWQEKQVLPAGWIAQSSIGSEANPNYGYFWWNMHDRSSVPQDTYFAYGRQGQFIVIIPSLDMLLVYFSNGRRALSPEGASGDAWFLLEDQVHPVFGKMKTEERPDAGTKLKPVDPHLNLLPLIVDQLVGACR